MPGSALARALRPARSICRRRKPPERSSRRTHGRRRTPPCRRCSTIMACLPLLRSSLIPGLLKAVRFNVDRQNPDVRLFEIGRVFGMPPPGEVLPAEREDLGVVVAATIRTLSRSRA